MLVVGLLLGALHFWPAAAQHGPPVVPSDKLGNVALDAADIPSIDGTLPDGGSIRQPHQALSAPGNAMPVSVDPFAERSGLGGVSTQRPDTYRAGSALQPFLQKQWSTGIWGAGIGASGMTILDIDNDGELEIVAGGGYWFDENRFWSIFSYSTETGGYEQEWFSQNYSETISRLQVADRDSDGQYEIYVAFRDGQVRVYSAITKVQLAHFTSALPPTFYDHISDLEDFTVADVDNDGEQEYITISSEGIVVQNGESYAVEWQSTDLYGYTLQVGNVDGDPAPEIVTDSYVIDGISHALEWDYKYFGPWIQLKDIDNDNIAEIISQSGVFDADVQAVKYGRGGMYALDVHDVDSDGVYEIVHADDQWGSIHVINSATNREEWSLTNPESGVSAIDAGDLDQDGVVEIFWGANWGTDAVDHLYVADTTTRKIEWQNHAFDGPIITNVGDVDNDGTNEIIFIPRDSQTLYASATIFMYDAETFQLERELTPGPYGRIYGVELADVDGDGVLELLLATSYRANGIVMAYDGVTLELDWITPGYLDTRNHYSAVAAADIDNDGQMEVIGGTQAQELSGNLLHVVIFDGQTGGEEWRTSEPFSRRGVYDIATGDFDDDGNPEFVFSVLGANAYIYDGVTQALEWKSDFIDATAVTSADVDQDGTVEILIGTGSGEIHAINGQTHESEWIHAFSDQVISAIRVSDLNEDQVPELTITDDTHLSVYDARTFDLIWQSDELSEFTGWNGHLVIDDVTQNGRNDVVFANQQGPYLYAFDPSAYDVDLGVDKSFVKPGDTLSYTLSLYNFVHTPLTAVVTNTIPTPTSLVAESLSAVGGQATRENGTILWNADLAAQNAASLIFSTRVDSDAADQTELTHRVAYRITGTITNTGAYTLPETVEHTSVTTLVDALPPTSVISDPVESILITGDVYTVTGSASDTTSGVKRVELRINGGAWQPAQGASSWTYTWTLPITDALHAIETRAIDQVGHVEEPGPARLVFVDNLPPQITGITPTHASTVVPRLTPISINFSEPMLVETFTYSCTPPLTGTNIVPADNNRQITIYHDGLEAGQFYRCAVHTAQDRVHHPLGTSTLPNPWEFTTRSPGDLIPGAYSVYMPLIRQ